MQDRVNYRFWDKEEKVMLDWDCICQTAFNCYIREEGNKMQRYGLMYWAFTTPSKFIPLQCTGLKDKNGKLIFEGDIIENKSGRSVVEWDNEFAHFKANGKLCLTTSFSLSRIINTNELGSGVSVIGNIYENPELLKEVQE